MSQASSDTDWLLAKKELSGAQSNYQQLAIESLRHNEPDEAIKYQVKADSLRFARPYVKSKSDPAEKSNQLPSRLLAVKVRKLNPIE